MKKFKVLLGSIICILNICYLCNTDVYAETMKARNHAEFRNIVYKEMLSRNDTIVVEYTGDDYKDIFELFESEEFIRELGQIDDVETSDDFDYMIQNVSYMKTSMKGVTSSKVRFTIEIKWRETLGQLEMVNLRVADIIQKEKITETESAYQRIKLVHDYIVNNVEYDTTLKYENAYSAIKEGKSTCQGYSLLFYKMLTEVGVPCRYITGTGINDKDNGPHGWNIVKIGEKWYNVDVTWDDPVYTDPTYKSDVISTEYFLKGSKNFDPSHVRDSEFVDDMFIFEYPTSEEDFNLADDVSIAEMVLGNSNLTQMMLTVPDEPEKEKEFPYNILEKINGIKESILNGTFSDYIVTSYIELSDNDKLIINALIILIFLSIVIKIVKIFARKKEADYDMDPEEEIMEITNVEELKPKENKRVTSVPKIEEDKIIKDDGTRNDVDNKEKCDIKKAHDIEKEDFDIKEEVDKKDDFDIEEDMEL